MKRTTKYHEGFQDHEIAKCNDFIDLGIEKHKKGKRIRNFLFLDSDFFEKINTNQGFDEDLSI